MSKKYNVAVMGATGAVGNCFLRILEERSFPVKNIKFLASKRSKGKKLKFKGKPYPVEALSHDSFRGIDLVLASAGASRSLEFLPSAVEAGAVCVDNSSAFRMDNVVPLVVPPVTVIFDEFPASHSCFIGYEQLCHPGSSSGSHILPRYLPLK